MVRRGPRLLLVLLCVLGCAALAPGLASAAEPGAIEGTVTEAGTGNPIEGAEVEAYGLNGEGQATGYTNGAGRYVIPNLAEGSYEVAFTGRTCVGGNCTLVYAELFYDGVKPFNPPTPVAVEAGETTENINGELERNGAIKGMLESASGQPIARSIVCVNSETEYYNACVLTEANGEYELPDLPPGHLNVQFTGRVCPPGQSCEREACERDGSCPQPYISQYYKEKLTIDEATPVTVTAAGTTGGIDATLSPGGKIEGKVILAGLEAPPLVGYTVCASPEESPANGGCVSTDAAGEYAIEGLADNKYLVEFKSGCEGPNCPKLYVEYYDTAFKPQAAKLVSVTAPGVVTGIDAAIYEEAPTQPSFKTPPVLSGNPVVGGTLSCSSGTWAYNPLAIHYVWLRGKGAVENPLPLWGYGEIENENEPTYVVTSADEGSVLKCGVTIDNWGGSRVAVTDGAAIPYQEKVAPPSPSTGVSNGAADSTPPATVPTTTPPKATGRATANGKATAGPGVTIGLKCDGDRPCKGSLKLVYTSKYKDAHGKTKTKKVVIGNTSFTIAAGSGKTVTVRLNAIGERLLRKAGKQGLTVQLTGTGVKGRSVVVH
jgi:hypothetical protein